MTWPSVRLKNLATLVAGGTPSVEDPAYWSNTDDGHAWVAIGDMSSTEAVITTARRITDEGLRSARLRLGDRGTLLFSMYASLGHTAWLEIPAAWNQAILGVLPRPGINSRFVRYSLMHLRPVLIEHARSTTQANLNAEQVGNLPIPNPPTREQDRIVSFLDAELTRINSSISIATKMRRLLLERREAMIFHAVVGGKSHRRMLATLPWAQSLPSTWQEANLGYVARMGSGHTPSRSRPEWWTKCTIPWITTGEVSQLRDDRREVLTETRECISEIGLANSAAELHPKNTVVLCRTAASAGYSAVMGEDMATSQDFVTWTCGPRLDPFFLLWCLRAMRSDLLGRLAIGSTHKTIYVPDLQMLRIPLPPLAEQRAIVESIRVSNAAIDAAVDAIDRQLALLAERRDALITAAVTGQIDVTAGDAAA